MPDIQQIFEVQFWRDHIAKLGTERFMIERREYFDARAEFFPELLKETGRGLDYGCGPVSVFEFAGLSMDACDPLLPQYAHIIPHAQGKVGYSNGPGPGPYDFIVCWNVIDHTPDPQTIIDNFKRLLDPGGRLYFMVNFDPDLYAPHYHLWRIETVKRYLAGFNLIRERIVESVFTGQKHYEGLYLA
jgi:SAM-dependent methyltransferase